ncbi:MAG: DUF4389 domain-containing protein [Flavobacteriales bacterium]|jgi:hypothetical protein
MKIGIKHQESYSRGSLILRSLFGELYIALPHGFLLIFMSIASSFVGIINFWSILITGKMIRSMFDFQLNLMRWSLRVNARLMNLSDGYPAFGMTHNDADVILDIDYPETSNRVSVLLRAMFGIWYVLIPHAFLLFFLQIGVMFVRMIAFWVVLITGKYPEGMHNYMVGVLRWNIRVSAFMSYLTDTYPPFSRSGNEPEFTATSAPDLLD